MHDPDLSNLSLEDFARWALLGTYIKAHGTAGTLRLAAGVPHATVKGRFAARLSSAAWGALQDRLAETDAGPVLAAAGARWRLAGT